MLTTRSTEDRGATLIEFAIIVPVFLLIFFGLIEFGRYVAVSTQVTAASREAARYGIATGYAPAAPVPQFIDCDGIRDAARARTPMLELDDADITVGYDTGPGTSVYLTCTTSPSMVGKDLLDGSRIVVHVTTDFEAAVPWIADFLGPTITATAARTVTEEGT